jgi:hypothetical protein
VDYGLKLPTTDGKLPSFVHPELAEVMDDLTIIEDCWDLLRNDKKKKYLPAEVKESRKAYAARLIRSSYTSMFRDAVIASAGVLSRFEVNGAPESMTEVINDVDRMGSSIRSFGMEQDIGTLKCGAQLMMVDMSPDRPARRGTEKASGRRPWLTSAHRSCVRNWRTKIVQGVERCTAVTILEFHETEDGDYGVTFEPRFRRLVGGTWQLLRVVEKSEGSGYTAVVDKESEGGGEGFFLDSKGNAMEYPPVVWYPAAKGRFGSAPIPLLSLANLTLDHLREYSDTKELLHLTALPTPVREGVLGSGPPDANGNPTTPAMILGPGHGIDLPMGGSFSFAEVTGAALDRHQAHLEHIETLIDRQTLSFLFSGSEKTATLSEAKESAFRSVMELWCSFTGETLDPDAGIEIKSGVFDKPLGPEELRLVQELATNKLLSRKSAIWLIDRAGLLPPDTTPEDEVKQLDSEEPEPPPPPALAAYDSLTLDENGLPVKKPIARPPGGKKKELAAGTKGKAEPELAAA